MFFLTLPSTLSVSKERLSFSKWRISEVESSIYWASCSRSLSFLESIFSVSWRLFMIFAWFYLAFFIAYLSWFDVSGSFFLTGSFLRIDSFLIQIVSLLSMALSASAKILLCSFSKLLYLSSILCNSFFSSYILMTGSKRRNPPGRLCKQSQFIINYSSNFRLLPKDLGLKISTEAFSLSFNLPILFGKETIDTYSIAIQSSNNFNAYSANRLIISQISWTLLLKQNFKIRTPYEDSRMISLVLFLNQLSLFQVRLRFNPFR